MDGTIVRPRRGHALRSTCAPCREQIGWLRCSGFLPARKGAVRRDAGPGPVQRGDDATNDAGENSPIAVTEVRRDADCDKGQHIDGSRSANAERERPLWRLASPPGEPAYDDANQQPRANPEQRRRLEQVVQRDQREEGRAIRKYGLSRTLDVVKPHRVVVTGKEIPPECGAMPEIG